MPWMLVMNDRFCSRRDWSLVVLPYQVGRYQLGPRVIAGAGHLQEHGRIEVARAEVVVAAVPADHRQAADDVEVVAVGKGRPAVLALRRAQVVRPDVLHAELRVLPGGVHEAKLPAGPVPPASAVQRVLRIDLHVVRQRMPGRRVAARLRRNAVRHHLLVRQESPGQARLIVEVHAGDVGPGAVDEGALDNATGAAADDVRIGPVAIHAQVHLMAAAHGAVGHEIDTGADEVAFLVLPVVPIEEVVAEVVLALAKLLLALGPPPVDEPVAAAADVAVDLDVLLSRRAMRRRRDGVLPRPEQPAVDVQVIDRLPQDMLGREGEAQLAAVLTFQRELQLSRRRRFPLVNALDGDVDALVCLVGGSLQREQDLQLGGGGRQGQAQ